MKRASYLLVIIMISGSINTALGQDQARSILDEVSKVFSSYKTIQADFSFTLSNQEADIEDTFEGKLVLEGNKYRLSMMGILIMCNGKMVWNYVEDLNEASILDPADSDLFNPTQIFNLYKENFKLETLEKKGSVYDIQLNPETDDMEYTHIILKVDLDKKRILGASYFGLDGNTYKIKISNTLTNVQVDDRFFTFDAEKYPGVEVFDMR